MRSQVLFTLVLATVTQAEHYIPETFTQLSQRAVSFNKAVSTWQGDVASIGSLLREIADINNAVKDASSELEENKTITVRTEDEDQIFSSAYQLSNDLTSLIDATIGAKPKVEAIPGLGKPIVRLLIGDIRGSVSKLSKASLEFMSDPRLEEAKAIARTIDGDLVRGIQAYE